MCLIKWPVSVYWVPCKDFDSLRLMHPSGVMGTLIKASSTLMVSMDFIYNGVYIDIDKEVF